MTLRGNIDWWTDAGPDTCDFCWRVYYVEVGYHCAHCDRPLCPGCAFTVFEKRIVLCPECVGAGGG